MLNHFGALHDSVIDSHFTLTADKLPICVVNTGRQSETLGWSKPLRMDASQCSMKVPALQQAGSTVSDLLRVW